MKCGEVVTLHADVTALLAKAGIADVDVGEAVADEHVRSAAYQRVVSVIADSESRERDHDVVAAILRDPHELGAKTAVVALVDSIALGSTGPAGFRAWSAALLAQTDRLRTEGNRAFLRRRVHDWIFCLSVEEGHVPTAAELAQVTDWMQRRLAEGTASRPLLALLAESGNTRKIRNIAWNRAGSRTPGRS